MFIYTARLTKAKLAAAVLLGGALLCLLIVLVARGGSRETFSAEGGSPEENSGRIAYLESLGWEVSGQPLESEEVLIPEQFSAVYEQYNALQLEAGFDLSDYKGKRAMRYCYEVLNYPTGENGVRANLLIYKNKVIGGDIGTTALDGFMTGLLPR